MSYPYLVRRNNHYYCRIWIPEDLKPHFNCCEIKRSLKTSNCNTARTLVKALVYRAERVFMLIRSGMLTNEQIKTIAANFIKSTLNRTEELRSIAVVTYEDGAVTAAPFQVGNAGQVAGVVAQSVSACESLMQRYKDQLFVNDFSAIEARLGWHLEQNNLSVDKSSKDYTKLCREILKAEIEVKKIEIERLKGNTITIHCSTNYLIQPAMQTGLLEKVSPRQVTSAVMSTVKKNWWRKCQLLSYVVMLVSRTRPLRTVLHIFQGGYDHSRMIGLS